MDSGYEEIRIAVQNCIVDTEESETTIADDTISRKESSPTLPSKHDGTANIETKTAVIRRSVGTRKATSSSHPMTSNTRQTMTNKTESKTSSAPQLTIGRGRRPTIFRKVDPPREALAGQPLDIIKLKRDKHYVSFKSMKDGSSASKPVVGPSKAAKMIYYGPVTGPSEGKETLNLLEPKILGKTVKVEPNLENRVRQKVLPLEDRVRQQKLKAPKKGSKTKG